MKQLVIILMSASCALSGAAAVKVSVDASKVKCEISPWLYGTGMEDVNHEIYGGLDAQRLYGESFEEPCPSPRQGHDVSVSWDKAEALDGADFIRDTGVFHQGKASQSLIPNGGVASIGNKGLRRWGVPCRAGKKMLGYVWTRGKVTKLEVALQDYWGGKTYAISEILTQEGTNWCKAAFALTPSATDAHGRFLIRASGTGRIWLDDAYLADEPTNEFGRLGCREDIVAAFQDEGVTFLRWGGSMVNTPDYKLKNMAGKGERRPYTGFWFRESSGGFGPYEFVRMANAMKLPCSVAINAYDTVEDAVRFATELKRYDTPIFVQIGNEEIVNWAQNPQDSRTMKGVSNYCAAVRRLVPAMRAANPKLKFTQSAMVMGNYEKNLMKAVFHGLDGVVDYWDVHVSVVEPAQVRRDNDNANLALKWLKEWNPKTTMKVMILEENGNNHGLDRALGHAVMLEKARAMGPDMLTSCPANALQPYLHNDNWWDQGAIFFTPTQVWLSPCGQAQKMASAYHRELLVEGKTDDKDVSVSATKARDGKSLVLHFVNTAWQAKPIDLKLAGADGMKVTKVVSLFGSSVKADNSPAEPMKVAPRDVTSEFAVAPSLRPYSYTVVVVESSDGDKTATNVAGIAEAVAIPELKKANDFRYSTNQLAFALNNGLAMTRGGRIWASWISGEDGSGAFTAASWSDDGGRTWTDTRMVIDGHDGKLPERTNIIGTFWLDPDGRFRCYTDHSIGHFDGRAGVWEMICENPDAADPQWSKARRIGHGHLINKPIVLANGDWALATYLNGTWKGPGSAFGAHPELDGERGATCYVSSDHGQTWEKRATVIFPAAIDGVKDWQEAQLVQLKNGTLRLFARVVDKETGCLMAADSKDGGRTFGLPRRLKTMDNTNARFQIQRLKSGRLVFVKHGKPSEFSARWNGRYRLTAYLSDDDGETWKGGLLLDEGCGSYPDLFQAPDGAIYVSHDHGRYDTAEIRIHRFTEADILAGKIVSQKSRLQGLVMRAMNSVYNSVSLPPKASESQQLAAKELRHYLGKIVGANGCGFKIRLITEESKDLGPDGFRIVRGKADDPVEIRGSARRGCLYGAYELLERFGGVRFYSRWCEKVPQTGRVVVPAGTRIVEKPDFAMRQPYWYDLSADAHFAAKLRANGWNFVKEKPTAEVGGDDFRFGGGLGSCHTFGQLCPVKQYFDQHPEYFSMVKGKRIKDYTQLCLTNPDVLDIVTSNVLERIRKDPTGRFFGVSQNDWYNFCECEQCCAVDAEEESHAGTVVRFVNAVAERVEKEFPDAIIETLAYQWSRKPPKKTKLRHNVMPCLCTIECDFAHSLAKSKFAENRSFAKDIIGWGRQTEMLYVWDYVTHFPHYPDPFANVRVLQDNVRFFRDHGVKMLFEQGHREGPHGGFAELKAWLLAKWMWNADRPIEPLLRDFFTGYYGAAAPYVRAYFDEIHRLQQAWSADGAKPLTIFLPMDKIPYADERNFAFADVQWTAAEKAVANDPAHAYNVRMGHFSHRYVKLESMRARTKDDVLCKNAVAVALARELLADRAAAKEPIVLKEWGDNERVAAWKKIAAGEAAIIKTMDLP